MKKKNDRCKGAAILAVLGIISIVAIVCGMLGFTASQQMRASQITRDMLKARLIAESGLNKAYNAIKSDFSKAKAYSEQASFDGGTYAVKSTSVTGGGANRAKLVSQGVCGLGRSEVSMDVENRPKVSVDENSSDNFFDLTFDLFSGGPMTISGNCGVNVTLIFSNGTIDMGGSSSVSALIIASASTIDTKKLPSDVTLKPNQPAQEVYTAALKAAIAAFKAYAQKNGAVYSSAADIPASPPGGVAYCTGSDAGWSGDGTGCFIFEGTFSGKHLNVTSVDGYPSLIVLSPSDIKLNAGTVLNGAVILPNSSLRFNGHAVIYGPLLVGQTMTGLGTADLYAGAGQGFNLPPTETANDNVVVTAWH